MPQVRPTNILAHGEVSFDGEKYVSGASVKPDDILVPGEVLFNNTNSTAWVGKTALFEGRKGGPVVCSNHITRIRTNGRVSSPFLVAVLNMMQRAGYFARLATNFNNQAGINSDTLANVVIPICNEPIRRIALGALDSAQRRRTTALEEANALLSSLDHFILSQLGLTLPAPDGRNVYAARLADVSRRLDPDFHSPRFRTLRQKIEHGKYKSRTIQSLCGLIQSGFAAGGDEQTSDSSVGIPHIRPLNISGTAELHFEGTKMVPRTTVEAGDILLTGEVLFNNTNSTAWVGKSVVFDAELECACSNHITRLRLADADDSPYYLAAVLNALRGLGYFALLSTNFNNQAGVNGDTLRAVRVPWPGPAVQARIATEIGRRRSAAYRLRDEAEALWRQAMVDFETTILGSKEATVRKKQ